MKQTSIDKINQVYVAIKDHEDFKSMAELLKDVIRAECMTPAKAGKFNIYNYVSTEENRPTMCGVYHDRGNKVASDAHILVAMKEDYPAEHEGKVMLKDGHNHPIYPKWESIIPKTDEAVGYKPYTFDREKFFKWVDELRVAHKAEYGKGIKWHTDWFVKVGPCGFKAEWFNRLIEAMDALSTDELYLHESGRRAAVAKSDKGIAILMPVLLEDNFGEDKPNHVILG